MTAIAGPAGYLPVLAVLGFLIAREFRRELRPPATAHTRRSRIVVTAAIVVAFSILALRFLDFHI